MNMIRGFLLLALALLWSFEPILYGADSVRVRGYTRKDGTYVRPHYRSAPDGNRNNNWSTRGNVNPYTGTVGSRSPSPSSTVSRTGDVYVNGYYRSDGTYVSPHYRSAPDGNPANNWSTKGNVNPYTGKPGTQSPPVLRTPAETRAPAFSPMPQENRVQSPAHDSQENSSAIPGAGALKMRWDDTDPILESQKQQAQKGFAPAQHALGMRYLEGNGVPSDDAKGRDLLSKAASQGHTKSKERLKELLRKETAEPGRVGKQP